MTTIKSFEEAEAVYTERAPRSRTYVLGAKAVRLQNNTTLRRTSFGNYVVRLHDTDIVTYFSDGDIRVRTGGWLTVTTFDRIREYLPTSFHFIAKVYYRDKGRRYMDIFDDHGNTWHFDKFDQVHLLWQYSI